MTDHCYTPLALFEMLLSRDTLDTMCIAALRGSYVVTNVSASFYLLVFFTTCLLEAFVYFPAGLQQKIAIKTILAQIFILNLATHPFIFLLVPEIAAKWHVSTQYALLFSEAFAPTVEMLLLILLYRYRIIYALVIAVCANLLSWWLGIHVFSFFLE